jgi:hypothetical protein
MPTVQVFDPPMCCPTGTCGSNPDVALARFAADLQWVVSQGVAVERYSLAQQPDKFASNTTIVHAMRTKALTCYPSFW